MPPPLALALALVEVHKIASCLPVALAWRHARFKQHPGLRHTRQIQGGIAARLRRAPHVGRGGTAPALRRIIMRARTEHNLPAARGIVPIYCSLYAVGACVLAANAGVGVRYTVHTLLRSSSTRAIFVLYGGRQK